VYFALGYARFRERIHHGVPLGLKSGVTDEDYLRDHGDACTHQRPGATAPAAGHGPAAPSATPALP
jgi:toxin CptA